MQPGYKKGSREMAEHKIKEYIKNYRIKDHSLGMAFIALFVIATIVGWPNFLKVRNLTNILRQVSIRESSPGDDIRHHQRRHRLSVGSMAAFVGSFNLLPQPVRPRFDACAGPHVFFALVFGSSWGALNGVIGAVQDGPVHRNAGYDVDLQIAHPILFKRRNDSFSEYGV